MMKEEAEAEIQPETFPTNGGGHLPRAGRFLGSM